MHEIYLVKVPETVDLLTQTALITIMTRSPHVGSYTLLMLVLPSITSFANSLKNIDFNLNYPRKKLLINAECTVHIYAQ